jgi:hypothetical protein
MATCVRAKSSIGARLRLIGKGAAYHTLGRGIVVTGATPEFCLLYSVFCFLYSSSAVTFIL